MIKKLLIIAACLVVGTVVMFYDVFGLIGHMTLQMRAGAQYMDSLSEVGMQELIERSVVLLDAHNVANDDRFVVLVGSDIPEDLRMHKINSIQVCRDEEKVMYVWMGGLDHTHLSVKRLTDGTFQIIARYDDENWRQLWPE